MVVSLATHYAPPTHKKEWFDNATDNLSTRLFYREEWVDNRKSICRALQKKPTNQPLDSFHLLSRILFALRPRSKPEYYKRPEPEQGGGLGFSSLLVSVCGIAQWRGPAISTENNILR